MSSRSRYTRLGVWLSGMLLAAAACGGGSGYNLKDASAATHTKVTHAKVTSAHPGTASGMHCDHGGADARR